MSASFEQLLEENLSTLIMKQGSLVTGIVIDILENHQKMLEKMLKWLLYEYLVHMN